VLLREEPAAWLTLQVGIVAAVAAIMAVEARPPAPRLAVGYRRWGRLDGTDYGVVVRNEGKGCGEVFDT
jgi:hypothetical protein